MDISTEYLHPVQAACEQWDDGRVITSIDLENLVLWWQYLPRVLSQSGYRYRGFVVRQKAGQSLLTVKVVEGDTPLVVFVTAATPTGCVSRFWDLWERDTLVWCKDRYPWI